MTSYFVRIFLSVWIILAVTATLILFAAQYIPPVQRENLSSSFDKQVIDLVASDLRNEILTDPTSASQRFIDRHELNFGQLFQIYVIDNDGLDILGRELPDQVIQVHQVSLSSPEAIHQIDNPRLTLPTQPLSEYLVIGYQGEFPVGRVLRVPAARGLLLIVPILVSGIVSYILARFIVHPIRHLRIAGQEVAEGNLDVKVSHTVIGRHDDIAMLARDFDVMTERINELLESQQRLMRDVSHELRSPLARLRAMLSIAEQSEGKDTLRHLSRMEVEVQRLDDLIGEILTFARLEARSHVDKQATDIVELLSEIATNANIEGSKEVKRVVVEAPDYFVAPVDPDLIGSSFENVVRNALKFTPPHSKVTISVIPTHEFVEIIVSDQGPGVNESILPLLFDPFYRGEEERGGQSKTGGIGLAIAKRAVELHEGTIQATNNKDAGLTVTIQLPL